MSSVEVPRALLERLAALEAESAIRRLMARYMELCDQLDENTSVEAIGALFTEDAVWEGRGARYRGSFGRHAGRAAIEQMFASYCGSPAHFTLNAHFLTSDSIRTSGETAHGSWMMLQTSSFQTGSHLTAARLEVDFRRVGETWRIARFTTRNIFGRPVSAWDDPSPLPVPSE